MVWGNLIDYPGHVTTKTTDLTIVKCLLNSVLSTPKAKCMCADTGNSNLMMPMEHKEYMNFPINLIQDETMDEYNLHEMVHKDHIYAEIVWGMYGLPHNRSLPSWTLLAILWQMCHVWITNWIVSGSVEGTGRPSYTKKKSTILHVFRGFMAALQCLEHLQDI